MAQAGLNISRIRSFQRLVSSIHGNGVFPDATNHVHIEHHATGAITRPGLLQQAEGKIHFPLPTLPAPEGKPRLPPYGVRSDGTLEAIPDPDEGQSASEALGTSVGHLVIPPLTVFIDFNQATTNAQQPQDPSYVSLVDVYHGADLLWSSGSIEKFTSFRLPIMRSQSVHTLAQSEKGISVTVTIHFGSDALQFSSVALIATLPTGSGTRIP